MTDLSFAPALLDWFDRHGRHDLPWQHPRSAYRVWVSEVMLQQTQVATVIPYFERFIARFPDVGTLADAPIDEVLKLWSGLGYYARARNLHRAAQCVIHDHAGRFPQTFEAVSALPGVGRSTAGAILAQAHGQRHAILDGNVRRVLARFGAIEGWPGAPGVQKHLWVLAERLLPQTRLADYSQALMDLGSLVCTARRPACGRCPVAPDCQARLTRRTDALPAPRPRRERPQRAARLLLLQREDGGLMLERRPPAGIWGGLWCLPLADADDEAADAAHHLGFEARTAVPLAPIHHGFTHFDLRLLPVHIHVAAVEGALRETADRSWINLALPDQWPGLPAPIRALLARLHAQPELSLETASNPCPEPSTASSSARKPKASTAPPTPGHSASASSKTSPRKPGKSGSNTRRA